jgi:Domain of unknown function (DUF4397)
MKNQILSLAAAICMLFSGSCKKSEDQATANLRFINMSPNSSAIDLYLNSALVVGNVSYPGPSSYQSINAAATSLSVNQATTANILLAGNIALAANNHYSTIVYDSVAILKGDIFQDDRTDPPAGKAFVRFFNYVSGTPSLDIIKAGNTSNKLFTSRTYLDHKNTGSYVSYTAIDPGPFSVSAVVAGTNVLITQLPSFEATAGKSYTLVLRGFNKGTGNQAVFLSPIQDK